MGRTFLPRWGGCRSPVLPFWEVAAIQTSALFWGVLAPPNPGVVPPPSGAKFALQEYMARQTNRDTGQSIPLVTVPNALLILEGSPPLAGWLFGRLKNWLKLRFLNRVNLY